jgi:hypothetical protein
MAMISDGLASVAFSSFSFQDLQHERHSRVHVPLFLFIFVNFSIITMLGIGITTDT